MAKLEFGRPVDVVWDAVKHGVTFIVYKDGEPIDCHVTRAAVDDNLCVAVTGTILDRARAQFDDIAEQIRRRIDAKAFESDGSILLRTGDWRQR